MNGHELHSHQHAGPPGDPAPMEWTCPMHPQIVRGKPGTCPLCGMALEPRTVTGAEEENPELREMTRRFWVSAALSAPLVLLAMLPHPGAGLLAGRLSPQAPGWVELLFATPVVLWGGWPFFVRGGASIVHRSLNMFTLIALGTGAAYVYSVIARIAPGIFPASFRDEHGAVGVYFEAAAVVVTLVLLGQVLELRARSRTGAAMGKGATSGVLFRNAEAIEVLRKVDTLVVDKTGTLTEGKPRLVSVLSVGMSEADLLRLAASLERASEHPLAAAIVAGAEERGAVLTGVSDFQSITGKGVTGTIDGRKVALGNRALMDGLGLPAGFLGDLPAQADEMRRDGQTVLFAAVDGRAAGLLGVADPVKESTPEAVRLFHRLGLRVVMLTGDNRTSAEAVAAKIGIDEVIAEVLPDQKAEAIQRLQRQGAVVAMAGDGVNDAPALAQAEVGIAMGTGTDVAMESAGVTLVKGDLRGIVRARRLSAATIHNIRQNLLFAFIYNALGVPVAAGVLYPAFGLLLSPMIAAAAMSFSSVSVIANSLRLRWVDLSL